MINTYGKRRLEWWLADSRDTIIADCCSLWLDTAARWGGTSRETTAYAPTSKNQVASCCNEQLSRRRLREDGAAGSEPSSARAGNIAAFTVGKSSAWRETTSYFSRLQPRDEWRTAPPLCPCRQPSLEKKLRDCQRQQWAISFVRSRYSPESLWLVWGP